MKIIHPTQYHQISGGNDIVFSAIGTGMLLAAVMICGDRLIAWNANARPYRQAYQSGYAEGRLLANDSIIRTPKTFEQGLSAGRAWAYMHRKSTPVVMATVVDEPVYATVVDDM